MTAAWATAGPPAPLPSAPDQEVLVVVATGRAADVLRSDPAVCQRINQLSGATIATGLAGAGQQLPCVLSGTTAQLSRAHGMIAALGGKPKGHCELATVAAEQVGLLIGKSGSTIRAIEQQSGAKLNVSDPAGAETANVRIEGSPEQCAAARSLVEAATSPRVQQANRRSEGGPEGGRSEKIGMSSKQLRGLVGKHADLSQAVKQQTGCRLVVPWKALRQAEPVELELVGEPEQLENGRLLLAQMMEKPDGSGPGRKASKNISIDAWKMSHLIGPAGQVVQRISKQSGARVQLPNKSSRGEARSETVKLLGEAEQVAAAEALIWELMDELSDQQVSVQQHELPLLLGKGGSTVKQIEADTGAKVLVAQDRTAAQIEVRLTGQRASVDAALERIQQLIDPNGDRACRSTKVVQVPVAHLGGLIGKNGKGIAELQEKTGASIHIPRGAHRTGTVEVLIDGTPEQLELLEAELPRTHQLPVETAQLPLIVGRAGATIHRIEQESGAKLTIPKQQSIPPAISISGTSAAIEHAIRLVAEAVDQPVEEHQTVEVERELLGLLIGKAGSTVNAIQAEFGTRVSIEQAADGDKVPVTVSGPKDRVEATLGRISEITDKQQPNEERRLDPADDALRTWDQLVAKYGDEYSDDELHTYWREECIDESAETRSDQPRPEQREQLPELHPELQPMQFVQAPAWASAVHRGISQQQELAQQQPKPEPKAQRERARPAPLVEPVVQPQLDDVDQHEADSSWSSELVCCPHRPWLTAVVCR